MAFKQIDCFKFNMILWRVLGIYPSYDIYKYYEYYSKLFIIVFVVVYDVLLSVNFFFLPRQLDIFIEEMIFYFTELAVTSKVLTFLFMRNEIQNLLVVLECDLFQPDADSLQIIWKAKQFIKRYWKIVAVVSYTSHLTHILSPLIAHLLLPIGLELPVCSYLFIPDHIKEMFIYPLYFYQSIGMHWHMLYNLNIDTFFLGLMILTIAQLNILDLKLRKVTDYDQIENVDSTEKEPRFMLNLTECIIHFDEIAKFCSLIEEIFSVTLFVQFSMASCIICVCLFRFTLPAPTSYYIFLATYMTIMIIQILVPCWFGTRIIESSNLLSLAVYNCDWTPRPRPFKSNLRLFVERANKPLSISGWKMFPLSLLTFTNIMNSSYSFFTLLRHMQTRQA